MLNFEREMLVQREIDLLELVSQDGDLIEHNEGVKAPVAVKGNWPIMWEWTLQDEEGRIWTELVDVPDDEL